MMRVDGVAVPLEIEAEGAEAMKLFLDNHPVAKAVRAATAAAVGALNPEQRKDRKAVRAAIAKASDEARAKVEKELAEENQRQANLAVALQVPASESTAAATGNRRERARAQESAPTSEGGR